MAIKFASDPSLEYDAAAETEGVDLDFGDGRIVTVRRAGGSNRRFAEIARAAEKPHKHAIESGRIAPEVRRAINIRTFADACVAGFRGFKDESGADVPYSVENARALLDAYDWVYERVVDEATSAANFLKARRLEALEAAKNS